MKITGWTWWEDPNYKDMCPVGGPFPFEDKWVEIQDLVATEIRDRGYKFTGDYHQNGDYGVPIIDDKWLFMVSMRAWGSVMVRAYPEEHAHYDKLAYCQWAWLSPGEMVVPKEEDYK